MSKTSGAMAAGESVRKGIAALLSPARAALRGPKAVASKVLGTIVGAPVNLARRSVASTLLGPKALMGPMRGKRLWALKGGPGKGMRQITRAEFAAIKGGDKAGKAYKARIGGSPYYYARKFSPRGLVGFAREHPFIAGGGALLGYKALQQPERARAMAQGIGGSALPSTQFDPAMMAQMQMQPSYENPLARQVWK